MQNIKITSEINSFKIGTTHYTPPVENPIRMGQPRNPKVNWFYLLDKEKETFRCFDENEAKQVIDFLDFVKQNTGFGNTPKACFTNNKRQDCVNNECEDEVCSGMKDSIGSSLRKKIHTSDFGINNNGQYTLMFNIIGFIY